MEPLINSKFRLTGVSGFYWILLLISESSHLFAAEILSDKIKRFEIKPQLCIVSKLGDTCHLTSKIIIQTSEKMPICLRYLNQSINCWQNAQSITQEFVFSFQASNELILVDKENTHLAVALLQVNSIEPKIKRRRLRSAWGLF